MNGPPERPSAVSRLTRAIMDDPWGRTLLIALTVAAVIWAVRETAVITQPIVAALQTMLVPLAIGFVIAYVLTPLVDAMQSWGMKRSIATPTLFALLGALIVIVISLGMPVMVRQSSDLLTRLFSDVFYYDANANRRFDKGEPIVVRGEDADGPIFFHDRDGDGEPGLDEPRFPLVVDDPDVPQVRFEPSLVRRGMEWLEATQQRVEIMFDAPPDQRSLVFLDFYLDKTRPYRERLSHAYERMMRGESADPALETETGPVAWEEDWPGLDAQGLEEALEEYDPLERQAWLEALVPMGRRLAERHRDILTAWQQIREGQGDLSPLAEELERHLATRIDPQRLQEVRTQIARLRESRNPADRQVMMALYTLEASGSTLWQRLLDETRVAVMGKVSALGDWAGQGAQAALSNVGTILQMALDVILVPIYAFFLVLIMPAIRNKAHRYLARPSGDQMMRLGHEIERAVAAFFRGRLLVCLLCAIFCAFGFLWLGVPYALLFGLLIGLATAVPLSGLLFLIPAVLLVVADGGEGIFLRSSLVVLVYTVIQTLEATVLTPTIMGREVELHPVVLIAALVFLGHLLGVLGLLLAVPIAATGRILLREFALPRLRAWAGVDDTRVVVAATASPEQATTDGDDA